MSQACLGPMLNLPYHRKCQNHEVLSQCHISTGMIYSTKARTYVFRDLTWPSVLRDPVLVPPYKILSIGLHNGVQGKRERKARSLKR